MKKMLLASAHWPCLLQDVLNRRLLFKQTGGSSTKGNHHHHFFVSGIGQKKTVSAGKICGGAESVDQNETQQTFVNGLLSFYYFKRLYSAGAPCIAHNNCMSCPVVPSALSALSLIYFWVRFQLFVVISLSLRVK